jgi:hypothetical protein
MALTSSSFQQDPQPPRDPRADVDAAANAFDATRMVREKNVSNVAAQHTSGPASDMAIGAAFIDGNSLGKATATAGKQAGATVPGSAGFPGLNASGYPDNTA